MNRDEALNVITIMATAWPYPEWDEGRVELWCAALNDEDAADCTAAAVKAVKTEQRAPTVAWLLEAAKAESTRRQPFGLPESSEVPASKDVALAGIAAARAALRPTEPPATEEPQQ